jgi:hypothetical protein
LVEACSSAAISTLPLVRVNTQVKNTALAGASNRCHTAHQHADDRARDERPVAFEQPRKGESAQYLDDAIEHRILVGDIFEAAELIRSAALWLLERAPRGILRLAERLPGHYVPVLGVGLEVYGRLASGTRLHQGCANTSGGANTGSSLRHSPA